MTLQAALAEALADQPVAIWTTHGPPWRSTAKTGSALAAAVLADPAFLAALTEALAEAIPVAWNAARATHDGAGPYSKTFSAALVSALLKEPKP